MQQGRINISVLVWVSLLPCQLLFTSQNRFFCCLHSVADDSLITAQSIDGSDAVNTLSRMQLPVPKVPDMIGMISFIYSPTVKLISFAKCLQMKLRTIMSRSSSVGVVTRLRVWQMGNRCSIPGMSSFFCAKLLGRSGNYMFYMCLLAFFLLGDKAAGV